MPTPNWWTEEDLAKLREMRANGDSIRFIARELKRHRGTIANKCKRLALPLSDKVGRQIATNPATIKKGKTVRLPPPARLPPFDMLHVCLVELDKPQCDFPLGDGPFTFCGHETGGATYCAFHAGIAYKATNSTQVECAQ